MFFRIYNQPKYRPVFTAVTVLMLVSFIITNNGCTTMTPVRYPREKLTQKSITNTVSYLILKDGKKVDTKNKKVIYADSIKSLIIMDYDTLISEKKIKLSQTNKPGIFDTVNIDNSKLIRPTGKNRIIPLSDVLEFFVEKEEVDASLTTLFVIGLIGAVALTTIFIKNATDKNDDPQAPPLPPQEPPDTTNPSCPLVYSFDGEKYVFDSEPLSGVISESLTRTDYSRLDFLKQSEGRFKLLVKNQPGETEMIDEIKLVTVPHKKNIYVTPNTEGEFFNYKKIIRPISVTDENGKDVGVFFKEKDNIRWQTLMPVDTTYKLSAERHSLKFRFPKPKDAENALLLVNCGSAYWGSKMIRVMLQMKGNKVNDWYGDLFHGDKEMQKLLLFLWREELFAMKVNLLEGNEYNTAAYIPSGGPLMDEDKIVRLPLQNVKGDHVEFILNPPAGFWKIDQIGMIYDYEITEKNKIQEYDAVSAEDQDGKDIRNLISLKDKNYYEMPDLGNHAEIFYNLPPDYDSSRFDIFLKTTGYYEIQTDKSKSEQTSLVEEIINTPGKIIDYSISLYNMRMKTISQSMNYFGIK